jgi:hypothetical protein
MNMRVKNRHDLSPPSLTQSGGGDRRNAMFGPRLNDHHRTQRQPHLPYSDDALSADLSRVRDVWREARRQHDRFSVYQYLTAVFELVSVWQKENRAIDRSKRALSLTGQDRPDHIEPFAAVIRCTSSRKHVDAKARSKWPRALMFAAQCKGQAEPVTRFMRRIGGINLCSAKLGRLSRRKNMAQ